MKLPHFSRIACFAVLSLVCNGILWAETIDLSPRMTPVKHQGERNTCNAFAATALMEFLLKEKTGNDIDLSESYTYYLGKTRALTTPYTKEAYSKDDGLAGFLAVKALEFGCMTESDWPYERRNWLQSKDPRCTFTNGQPDLVCFIGQPPNQATVLPQKVAPIFIEPKNFGRYLLKNKTPIVFNILWYEGAVNNQTGEFHLPTAREKAAGEWGHVILLVGYDSEARKFVFRNSWGPGWGKSGYGTIPEEYILSYGEAAKCKPFSQYPPDVREFLETGSMGVSAVLEEE